MKKAWVLTLQEKFPMIDLPIEKLINLFLNTHQMAFYKTTSKKNHLVGKNFKTQNSLY